MATTANFGTMLKEYTPHNLFIDAMKRRNYFWNKVKKDQSWKGGTYVVPFEGGEYSSLKFGALTASASVANMTPVEGQITSIPELWGTLKFAERDLRRHGSMEQSFLKILPGKLSQFTERMSERVSLSLLNDGAVANLTADGEADGEVTVDHPELFTIGEEVHLADSDSTATGFVTAINMDTKKLTVKDARSAGSAVNLSSIEVAKGGKVYLPEGDASGFTSLASILLSNANGGAATVYGKTKTDYPYLQAQNHDGSSVDESNILDFCYDIMFDTVSLGKSGANEIIMSLNNFKHCAKLAQIQKEYVESRDAGYGFNSITLIGPNGNMKLTGVLGMAEDKMYVLDWSTLVFAGNNFFNKKRYDNSEYFLERATTGYSYLVDVSLEGDLICLRPSANGVAHSINIA